MKSIFYFIPEILHPTSDILAHTLTPIISNCNKHILLMLVLMCCVYVASTARLLFSRRQTPHLWLCFRVLLFKGF